VDILEIKKVEALLIEPRKIVIVTHKNPDGDAIGSSLALYHYLKLKGHSVNVIVPNEYPQNLKWLTGNQKVVIFEGHVKKASTIIKEAQVIFCLDFNSLKRIDEMGDVIASTEAIKIIIDHHLQPDDFADIVFSEPAASSTAQMIYNFIEALGDVKLLNADISNAIYMGIMTDTGSFRFPTVTARTHHVLAHLIESGATNYVVHDKVFDTNRENRLRLLGYCLSEKMKVFEEFHAALITLTKEELKRFQYNKGDTEGFVNYPLSIQGIQMAAFFTEGDDSIRMSFRSKGSFSVNELARTHFEGGGHRNAAGGTSYLSMDETISKFITLLPQYRAELGS
jgi:bifunctional oligoribonuclease and PAP phosphatase NrnA